MEKKNVAIVILAIALIGSGVGNIILGTMLGFIQPFAPAAGQDIVYGEIGNGLVDMDPAYAYDTASSGIIENVCEPLYTINWSDPEYPIIPLLASGMPTISTDGLEYTINLRVDVAFHDGVLLNATVAKWTLDRYNYFINWSGNSYYPADLTLGGWDFPFDTPLAGSILTTQTGVLFMTSTGDLLINRTEILGPYQIKIVLNELKGSFMSLLSFYGLCMLSPDSTPPLDYYSSQSFGASSHEKLTGTGPFKFEYFLSGIEEKLVKNEDYWAGASKIDSVTYVMYADVNTINQAFLSGDINVLLGPAQSFFAQINSNPDFVLINAGPTFNTAWVSFNYDHMSLALRKAISFALNYSYIIDVVYNALALRFPTYIPQGILYADYSLNVPIFNRTEARAIMLADPSLGALCAARGLTAASSDSAWLTVASTNPILSLNYTWNLGNTYRENTGYRLEFDLTYIGIDLTVLGVAWGDLLSNIRLHRENMDMYMLGWAPDYLDPENYITPIWSNTSEINGGNFYEPDCQVLMDQGLIETDPVAREAIYKEIQRLMVEVYFPGMPLTTGINWDAWVANFHGYVSNPASRLLWYPCYFS